MSFKSARRKLERFLRHYGGLQFNATTWHNYGGPGLPHQASKATQINIAEKVLAKQGWGAWPVCSRKAGLR
jgi:hypothetical protein